MRLLLVTIADFMDENDRCWPAAETIAERSGYCERQVRGLLDDADRRGLVRRWWGDHRSRDIEIRWDALAVADPKGNGRGGKREAAKTAPHPAKTAGIEAEEAEEGGKDCTPDRQRLPPYLANFATQTGKDCTRSVHEATKEASREATTSPADVGPESEPTPNQETTDGRHGASEHQAADPRPDHEPDDADSRGPDPHQGGADLGEGGAGAAGGSRVDRRWPTDHEAVWTLYRTWHPRAGSNGGRCPESDRTILRRAIREWGADDVRLLLTWAHTAEDTYPRQLRGMDPWPDGKVKSRASVEELLRADKASKRVDEARAWDARRQGGGDVAKAATGGTSATVAGGQATSEAERAWDVVQAAALDSQYHAQHAPERFSSNPDRDRRVRRALRVIGGWPALVSDIRDHWRARDMRATFIAAYASEAA
jgi:hypothetical protein